MRNAIAFCVVGLILAGCGATLNPFTRLSPDYTTVPEAALQDLTREIERNVRDGNRQAVIENTGGLVLDTPEIRQAIRTRAARAELLDQFLSTGHACEEASGLVKVLRSKEYKRFGSSRDRDRYALLVMSENNDRWVIYEGIVKASKLSPRSLSAVQHAFYEARIELMPAGRKYEDGSGNIVVKQ